MNDDRFETLTDAQKELWAEFEECGILKVRNSLEDGEYGPCGSPNHDLAEYWLEKQHRKQFDNVTSLRNEPGRLALVALLLVAFFALLYYIAAF